VKSLNVSDFTAVSRRNYRAKPWIDCGHFVLMKLLGRVLANSSKFPPVFDERQIGMSESSGCGHGKMIPLLQINIALCHTMKGTHLVGMFLYEFGASFDVGEEEGDNAGW